MVSLFNENKLCKNEEPSRTLEANPKVWFSRLEPALYRVLEYNPFPVSPLISRLPLYRVDWGVEWDGGLSI